MNTTITVVQMNLNDRLIECSSNGRSWEVVGVISQLTPAEKAQAKSVLDAMLKAAGHDGPGADERRPLQRQN